MLLAHCLGNSHEWHQVRRLVLAAVRLCTYLWVVNCCSRYNTYVLQDMKRLLMDGDSVTVVGMMSAAVNAQVAPLVQREKSGRGTMACKQGRRGTGCCRLACQVSRSARERTVCVQQSCT